MPFVYSTLTDNVAYSSYHKHEGIDLPVLDRKVIIKGGSNVADKKTLITPHGVVTQVSDNDLEFLEKNEVFKVHKKNGFIRVSDRRSDPEKISADMEGRDEAAPLVDADFEEGKQAKVHAGQPRTK